MENIFWYASLSVIALGGAIYSIYKKRNVYKLSTLLVFYLFAASIAWIGEFIVLGLFNSYQYKTGIFTDIWAQNLFGHLILNTAIYPSLAIIMIAFSFRYGWICFCAVLLTAIEYFFVKKAYMCSIGGDTI